ncbi:hypothetical protein HWD35_18915 [Tsukamurella tyrosinosolvens]|uniref:hypothetical protein n=1 Tax=Tsukamurella tyrosinosolvens TaxID=57704 RepID=UPI001CE1A14B|nr:hypothetical protein [Tsukamurella tyrosinosolvens]MCA4996792.1 hypothetical protein [Tsukamurella tyrosinosolvens]
MLLRLVGVVDLGGHEPGEQLVERLVVVDSDAMVAGVAVFVDVDLGEEGLVEGATRGLVGLKVGGMAVACEIEDVSEGAAGRFVVGFCSCEGRVDSIELACDALLLGLEKIQRDRSCVVRV